MVVMGRVGGASGGGSDGSGSVMGGGVTTRSQFSIGDAHEVDT